MSATSVCGDFLDTCTCPNRSSAIPRSQAEMEARHKAAVARALRSEWTGQVPADPTGRRWAA